MCPHDMGVGGSQLNAIELAARVNSAGHPTAVFGRPGPLVDRVHELGLDFIVSPPPGRRPSVRVARALATVIRDRRIDVVHGYEWPPALEAFLACRRDPHAVAVGTVMSMAVAPFLPRTLPLQVGTEQIAAAERLVGRSRVSVLEPPVDLVANDPAAPDIDVAAFRSRWAVPDDGALTVVMVTRLAQEMKLEGILVAVDVVGALAGTGTPIRLVVVGDGPAGAQVRERAGEVNRRTGRATIVLTGELADPRPAYAVGDVHLGMGGSALRAMAFGSPLIVQGEQGFWRTLDETSVGDFFWTGWYGVGSGGGPAALTRELHRMLDPEVRRRLGRYARSVVELRFSLDSAAESQIAGYRAAVEASGGAPGVTADLVRSAAAFLDYKARRKLSAWRNGGRPLDDFNSRPVAASGPVRPSA